MTSGVANTPISVNGSAFLPNQQVGLIWDPPLNKVAGSAIADGNGNFATKVTPFPGDPPGVHRLCANVPPNPCATFSLQGPTTSPSPDASPSPSPEPSPSPTGNAPTSPIPTPVATTINGLDIIFRPPFVILPIIGGLGLVVALAYWILSIVLRPRQQTLKSVAVSHLAARPDYSAGFGAPPPTPAPTAPTPSAWADPVPPAVATTPEAPPEEILEVPADDPLLLAWADVLPSASPPPSAAPEAGGDAPAGDATTAPDDEAPDRPQPGD